MREAAQVKVRVVMLLVDLVGLLSFPAVVNSFTTIPLQCSLREPKHQHQQSQFRVPQIPFFNTINNIDGGSQIPSSSSSSSSSSSLGKRSAKLSKQDEEEYAAMKKGIDRENNSISNNNDPKILQNRSAIMEHALQYQSKELDTMNRRNTLLQDVVKKLQLSNRNLLDKVHQLQHEKEGMHISTDSEEELWPPEMEMEVLREEFNSKEMEWQNALMTAQWKYTRLRDEYLDVQMKLSELMQEISDAQEKALYYEERAAYDDNEINGLRVQVEENKGLIEALEVKLKSKMEEMKTKDDKDDGRSKILESKLEEMESKVADLEAQNEKAKVFIQDLRQMSKEKRDSITQIVMDEREKNRNTVNKLKSAQEANIELKAELKRMTDDMKSLRGQVKNSAKESKLRRQEEEERAKSLDVATSAVRKAEIREKELKKKLKKIENRLNKEQEEKLALDAKIEVLESAAKEQEQELKDQNTSMEPKALENDLIDQINELEVELSKVQDSRDILCRQELRLRQVLAEDRERHLSQISANEENWGKKIITQEMEFDLVEKELRSQITSLNDTINQQEKKIDELSLRPIQEESLSDILGASPIEANSDINSSKRFKRIRKRVRKLKEWLRS